MLMLADVKPGEIVYDLGCGDGRIVITAAREFGAYAVGIEIRKDLALKAMKAVEEAGLTDRVKIINANFFDVDISDADVVTLYLTTSANLKVKPKLERELKPGARVVSHEYEIPGWTPVLIDEFTEDSRYRFLTHRIWLYRR